MMCSNWWCCFALASSSFNNEKNMSQNETLQSTNDASSLSKITSAALGQTHENDSFMLMFFGAWQISEDMLVWTAEREKTLQMTMLNLAEKRFASQEGMSLSRVMWLFVFGVLLTGWLLSSRLIKQLLFFSFFVWPLTSSNCCWKESSANVLMVKNWRDACSKLHSVTKS